MFAVMFVVCLAALSLTVQSGAAQQADPNNRFGIVNGYEAPEVIDALSPSWELVTIRWDELQPSSSGQWQTDDEFEAYLQEARQSNRDVVATLVGTPAWATDGNATTGVPSGLYLPEDSSDNRWAVFVARAVDYYADFGITKWVIWENPDVGSGVAGSTWDGSVEDYFQLLKVAHLVANSANPNVEIHLGGIRYRDPTWFGDLMDEIINDPDARDNNYYFDIASVHLFGASEDAFTQTGNMYFVMSQRSIPLKPVWVNRLNARPADDPAYSSGQTFNEFPNITLEQQASYVIQAHALAFAAGADRISFYRAVDNLNEDGSQAYGLVRANGTERPAFQAYQTATDYMSGFVFARRVDEEASPLMDYVRLTFPDRVVHIVWARTELDATINIPPRSSSAILVDALGNQQEFETESGLYRVSVAGASCDDPVFNCLIGGPPLILVENDVSDPINAVPPPVTVNEGGQPIIITPQPQATATATITPTAEATPTSNAVEESPEPAPAPAEPTTIAEVVPEPSQPDESATLTVAEAPPQPPEGDAEAPPPEPRINEDFIRSTVQPQGFLLYLPFTLIGLGAIAIGFGSWYLLRPTGKRDAENDDAFDEPESTPLIIALGSGEPVEDDINEGYEVDEFYDEEYDEEVDVFDDEAVEEVNDDFLLELDSEFDDFDESEEDYRLD